MGWKYGRTKVDKLPSVISNRDINLGAHGLLLLTVVGPSLEYGREVWEVNKAAAFESVRLGVANHIIGCSSMTCNAVREAWDWIVF